jgi:hypothetical protein
MKHSGENRPDEIDPRLFEILEQLRPTPPRDPEVVARGRMKFQAEMESLGITASAQTKRSFITRWLGHLAPKNNGITDQRDSLLANSRKQRFSFTGAMVLILLLIFLFGGAGMTALAAQPSLPGDALYPVKVNLEHIRLALARETSLRAELHMEFAERRLSEISGLLEEGRFENIPAATTEFEAHINNALVEQESLAQVDPEQAAILARQVSEAFTRYALIMNDMADQVPESVRLEMRRALQVTQESGKIGELEFTGAVERMGQDTWVVAGRTITMNTTTEMKGPFATGDMVRIHAFINQDGSLTAREIERIRDRQGIENENSNIDSRLNENQNQNANQNTNLEANDNSNTNDGNLNVNESDTQNRDQNQNGNEDDSNQNLNQTQNQNDNQTREQNKNQNQTDNDQQNDNQNLNQDQKGNTNDNGND